MITMSWPVLKLEALKDMKHIILLSEAILGTRRPRVGQQLQEQVPEGLTWGNITNISKEEMRNLKEKRSASDSRGNRLTKHYRIRFGHQLISLIETTKEGSKKEHYHSKRSSKENKKREILYWRNKPDWKASYARRG